MKYHGGKTRIGKQIAYPILTFLIENTDLSKFVGYWDATAGALGVTKRLIPALAALNPKLVFIASDINSPLIDFWKAIQAGFRPPTHLTAKEYEKLRETKETTDPLHVFVSHASSFGGRPFAARLSMEIINRQLQSSCRNIYRMLPVVTKIRFFYQDMFCLSSVPKNLIIYLDPPYYYSRKTQGLIKTLQHFDNEKFWKLATLWSQDNLVFVSETQTLLPDDWVEICSFLFRNRFGTREYSRIEKVFVHRRYAPLKLG